MVVMEKLLTDHLDLWTAAIKRKSSAGRGSSSKIELYGIKKLRELILDLAVRGLLVSQDPNDEPASELLKKIAAEKAKLMAAGTIKQDKPFPLIKEAEKPYPIPAGWNWVRLGEVGNTQTGGTPKKADAHHYGSDVPFIKPGDIIDGEIVSYENDGLSFEGAADLGRVAPSDSVLMVCIGTIGKCARVNRSVAFNQQINSISPYLPIGKYTKVALQANYFQSLAWNFSSSTTISILNKGKWEAIPFPLAPLAEQHRIVAKVDELMALCDQLEQQTDASLSAHQSLVETLLNALTSVADHAHFASAWQRIAMHFDALFTSEESIDHLKQAILQLAVMGKLVPQDSNDEPASELLKKIGIGSEMHPLIGWASVSLGQLGKVLGGATPSKSNREFWSGDIPWVSPKDMKQNFIADSEDHVSEAAISSSSLKEIPTGSLLMVVRGMILAHSFPIAITKCEVTINQDMKALVIPKEIQAFVLLYMQAMKKSFVALVDRSTHGTCKIVSEKLWAHPVLLPPLAEQQRIVSKVNELIVLCDELKFRLSRAQTIQLHLADALTEKALARA
jgi:type I restriction enzyme S subunit